jgi:hypothetical protein
MNNETQRIMEALMLIYGRDLQAATITVLEELDRRITMQLDMLEI